MSKALNLVDLGELLTTENGFTVKSNGLITLYTPVTTGYAVAAKAFSLSMPAPTTGNAILHALSGYISEYAHLLTSDSGYALGAWLDNDTDTLWLDIVRVLPDENRAEAIALGRSENQIAIFHLTSGEEIPTGGTGDRVTPAYLSALSGGVRDTIDFRQGATRGALSWDDLRALASAIESNEDLRTELLAVLRKYL